MKLNDYQDWAVSISSLRNVQPGDVGDDTRVLKECPLPEGVVFSRLDHGISGIASEAGELSEHLKHVRFHGKALDVEHVAKELGDQLWYICEAAKGIGWTLEEIAARNQHKLKTRYPEGHFTVSRSENRNPDQE